jgi:hypothetical protein
VRADDGGFDRGRVTYRFLLRVWVAVAVVMDSMLRASM